MMRSGEISLRIYAFEVIRAGLGDWDTHSFAASAGETDRDSVAAYLRDLLALLEEATTRYREDLRMRLGKVLVDTEGRPVTKAFLVDERDGEQRMLDGPGLDDIYNDLSEFQRALFGDGPWRWRDDGAVDDRGL